MIVANIKIWKSHLNIREGSNYEYLNPYPFDIFLSKNELPQCGILTSVDSDEPVQPPFITGVIKFRINPDFRI